MPFLLRSKSYSSCDLFLLQWCSTANSRELKISIPVKKCTGYGKWIYFKYKHALVLSLLFWCLNCFNPKNSSLFFSAAAGGKSNLFLPGKLAISCSHMAPGTATLALRKRLNIVRSLKKMLDLVTLLLASEEKRICSGENTYPSYYEEENSV